ncbi:MFS transporter [Micromonospora sp. CPCC 206061]|uniref:MFS transporter n=1 Tax=Micromonospora sp. CPCC 206061 TaxID=3122410 RepID=UPI002FF29DA1
MTNPEPAATTTRAGRRREERTLLAAALTNGPNELIDFVLPLWAGASLGMSGSAIGALLAVEMAVSVIVRPIAGVLADRRERRHIAAVGALLYAVSCLGYAVGGTPLIAYTAAAIGGAGGALLWVSVRAIVSERLAQDSAVFPRLFSSQETGSWIAFIAGMSLIGPLGFRAVFLACAAACVLAAALLWIAPRRQYGVPDAEGHAVAGLGAVGRRLRPMLFAVAMTMMAEAAVGLLLMLHLQREFGLEVMEVALVFLPGAIAMSAAAPYLHRYTVRYGRTRVLAAASLSSTAFVVGLAWVPNPYTIAALWILSGLAWAAVMPIQQAVVAEASGDKVGRGMGVYESASLVGALVGTAAAGVVYDHASWAAACLATAAMLLAGAVVVPRAVRRLGVTEFPPPAPTEPAPRHGPQPSLPQSAPEPPSEPALKTAPAPATPPKQTPPRKRLVDLAEHVGLYIGAQVVLAFLDLSWIRHLFTGDAMLVLNGTNRDFGTLAQLVYGATRVWAIILVIDIVWTFGTLLTRRPPRDPA